MHSKKIRIIGIILFMLIFTAIPLVASATTIFTVSKLCTDGTNTTCFSTISGAISAANPTTTGDIIEIKPDVYTEATLSLKNGLTIRGLETARTVIQNSSGATVMQAVNISGTTIEHVTINFATGVGIQVLNSSLDIHNNVIRGNNGTAIEIQTGAATLIEQNTFYNYQNAISSTDNITISNNIFFGNGSSTVLVPIAPLAKFTLITGNYFYNNSVPNPSLVFQGQDAGTFVADSSNIPNTSVTYADPLFVDPNDSNLKKLDFHVREGSKTLLNGSGSVDIGAFGPGTDNIPFPVSIISLATNSLDSTAAMIAWTPNLAWDVTNATTPGSYDVVYTLNTGGTTTETFTAPTTTADITGLTATASPPGPPILVVGYSDRTLNLAWTAGTGATGYLVNYLETGTTNTITLNVGNVTVYPLTGLVNGQHYNVWLTPYAQAVYTFAVFVTDSGGNQSASSPTQSLTVGPVVFGLDSNTVKDVFPEKLEALPNLPNSGCFIATAAYGYYSAPQVQILRDFRDRYLLTNGPGRAFVAWYYHYGPIGAEFMNAHPWTKPMVRIMLLPLIGAALFMIKTSLSMKLAVILCCGMIVVLVMMKKDKLVRSGGAR